MVPYHEGKEVSDDHKPESKNEAEDSSTPRVRVDLVVHVLEHLLDAVPLGNALALEELLSFWNLKIKILSRIKKKI